MCVNNEYNRQVQLLGIVLIWKTGNILEDANDLVYPDDPVS